MDLLILISFSISFLICLLGAPFWIRKTREIGLVWPDMNKYKSTNVSGSGGIIVSTGFIIGLLSFISFRTFYLETNLFLPEILAALCTIILLSGIGLIDDLLGWRKGGLSKRSRLILIFISAIPLMAINAGRSIMSVPLIGPIEFGIIYPLVLIPIGIVGASTTFNFLAGFNGLEAGQGILLLFSLGIVSLFTGSYWLMAFSLCMIASLIAFLLYNFYPAKIFPGDSLTYSVGGLIAVISILGNFEKIAIFFFIPYILETCLKLRGRLEKHSFGKPTPDNCLELNYDKIYSLNHLSIFLLRKNNIKVTEKKVVFSIWLFQTFIIILGFIIFREGIFL
jgi:UDP-N-acetylglucosamine--dolichyl-phosphate N-acetylglucosaminephosphotransferase